MTKKKKRVERCRGFDSFVSRDVRVMAGGYALWFENSDSGVGLMVRPSGVKSKWFLVSLEDPSNPLDLVFVEHEGVVAARVWYVREACLSSQDMKAAIRVFGQILPGGPRRKCGS
jgi:hypothetical protein